MTTHTILRKVSLFTGSSICLLLLIAAASARAATATNPAPVFVPATANAKPYAGDFGPLPTGAREFSVELPKPAKALVVNAAEFGITENSLNLATELNKVIAHCKKVGASKLILNRGNYRVTESLPITFDGLKDFEFDAQGSTFVYRKEKGENMRVVNCERVLFDNFNFDWDWETDPLASLAEVVGMGVAGENPYVDFKFLEYDKFPNPTTRMMNTTPYDLKTQSVGWEGGVTAYFCPLGVPKVKQHIEWLSDNVVRIYYEAGVALSGRQIFAKFKLHQVYRIQHYYYHMNGMVLQDNTHLTLQNINVYSCTGHAFLVSGKQQFWQMLNVNIKRPAGAARRAITCTADHLHIDRSLGFFKMLNCEFSLGADDCINMHDNSGFARRTSDFSITSQNARVATQYKVGELIELRQGDYSPSGFQSKIKELKKIDAAKGIFEITFADKVPEPTQDGFIMFSRDYDTHNMIVRNCNFHGNRARGILILARDVTIENNRFYHQEMGAIRIETGYSFDHWSEGYGARNIVIRNNTFEKSVTDDAGRDIYMSVYMRKTSPGADTMFPILADILIENNTFKDSSGYIIKMGSTGNVTIRNNTFINETPRLVNESWRGTFSVAYSTDARIVNNTWVSSTNIPAPGVYYDARTSPGIVIQGNKVVAR